jgi:hypothetical protein
VKRLTLIALLSYSLAAAASSNAATPNPVQYAYGGGSNAVGVTAIAPTSSGSGGGKTGTPGRASRGDSTAPVGGGHTTAPTGKGGAGRSGTGRNGAGHSGTGRTDGAVGVTASPPTVRGPFSWGDTHTPAAVLWGIGIAIAGAIGAWALVRRAR